MYDSKNVSDIIWNNLKLYVTRNNRHPNEKNNSIAKILC